METWVNIRKKEIETIKVKICRLLGWDEMQYNRTIYECGLAFIEKYYRDADLIRAAERSKAFWDWWKVAWWNADENMLTFQIPAGFSKQKVREIYEYLHVTDEVAKNIYPAPSVWRDIKEQLTAIH